MYNAYAPNINAGCTNPSLKLNNLAHQHYLPPTANPECYIGAAPRLPRTPLSPLVPESSRSLCAAPSHNTAAVGYGGGGGLVTSPLHYRQNATKQSCLAPADAAPPSSTYHVQRHPVCTAKTVFDTRHVNNTLYPSPTPSTTSTTATTATRSGLRPAAQPQSPTTGDVTISIPPKYRQFAELGSYSNTVNSSSTAQQQQHSRAGPQRAATATGGKETYRYGLSWDGTSRGGLKPAATDQRRFGGNGDDAVYNRQRGKRRCSTATAAGKYNTRTRTHRASATYGVEEVSSSRGYNNVGNRLGYKHHLQQGSTGRRGHYDVEEDAVDGGWGSRLWNALNGLWPVRPRRGATGGSSSSNIGDDDESDVYSEEESGVYSEEESEAASDPALRHSHRARRRDEEGYAPSAGRHRGQYKRRTRNGSDTESNIEVAAKHLDDYNYHYKRSGSTTADSNSRHNSNSNITTTTHYYSPSTNCGHDAYTKRPNTSPRHQSSAAGRKQHSRDDPLNTDSIIYPLPSPIVHRRASTPSQNNNAPPVKAGTGVIQNRLQRAFCYYAADDGERPEVAAGSSLMPNDDRLQQRSMFTGMKSGGSNRSISPSTTGSTCYSLYQRNGHKRSGNSRSLFVAGGTGEHADSGSSVKNKNRQHKSAVRARDVSFGSRTANDVFEGDIGQIESLQNELYQLRRDLPPRHAARADRGQQYLQGARQQYGGSNYSTAPRRGSAQGHANMVTDIANRPGLFSFFEQLSHTTPLKADYSLRELRSTANSSRHNSSDDELMAHAVPLGSHEGSGGDLLTAEVKIFRPEDLLHNSTRSPPKSSNQKAEGSRVYLRVYDISEGMAQTWSKVLMFKNVEGIWHSGIVAYGHEYFYSDGILRMAPHDVERSYAMQLRKVHYLGETKKSKFAFERFLERVSPAFNGETYDILEWNCNDFSNVAALWLKGALKFADEGRPQHAAASSSTGSHTQPPLDWRQYSSSARATANSVHSASTNCAHSASTNRALATEVQNSFWASLQLEDWDVNLTRGERMLRLVSELRSGRRVGGAEVMLQGGIPSYLLEQPAALVKQPLGRLVVSCIRIAQGQPKMGEDRFSRACGDAFQSMKDAFSKAVGNDVEGGSNNKNAWCCAA